MSEVARALRHRVLAGGLELEKRDLFDLVALSCMMCCNQIDGGNRTCPPTKIEMQV